MVGRDGVHRGALARQRTALADVGDATLQVLQSAEVAYRGQPIALVVATTPEAAREAAGQLQIEYDAEPHDTVLTPDHPTLYSPGVGQCRLRDRLDHR